jgi:putative ABC transport system substrate-binding protein
VKRFVLTLVMLGASVTAVPAAEKIYRLGDLEPTAASAEITRSVILPELATLGFKEQVNLAVDERVGDATAFPRLAQELVLSRPDAIIAFGGNAILAAHNADSTVPIVAFGGDLVQLGLAASLARPGGNVTGVVLLGVELDAKRLELLHETVPTVRRMAALVTRSARISSEVKMRAVAANNGIELLVFEGDGPDDYPAAFAAMRAAGAQALAMTATPNYYRDAALLARLALEAGLPTICEFAETAHFGCLIGYGPDRPELRRRMAHQVARIFRGAAPGDLPIEQPTHYELAINLNTAKALGLTVPQSLLAGADEVIE